MINRQLVHEFFRLAVRLQGRALSRGELRALWCDVRQFVADHSPGARRLE